MSGQVVLTNKSFSILTVSGTPIGNGIFLQGRTMTLSGTRMNSGIIVLDQLSISGSSTGGAGTYKISCNANTSVQTMYSNDSVTNNANLYISSIASGEIVNVIIFKLDSQYFNINSLVSPGVYAITSTGIIPSIYPQQISASMSFSTSISINVRIPDGFYDSTSLNYYLQNVSITNNLYLTDNTGSKINTYYFEILQN